MIGEILTWMKEALNDHLLSLSAPTPADAMEQKVVYVESDPAIDHPNFKANAISLLLINIEEEKIIRSPDQYQRISQDGTSKRVHPDLRLNLYILFVAKFKEYKLGLQYLSVIMKYFQVNRTLTISDATGADHVPDPLVVEYVSLSMAEQNELWGMLRTGYMPCALYRLRTLIYTDEDSLPNIHPLIGETNVHLETAQ